jgi:hypothetical protein
MLEVTHTHKVKSNGNKKYKPAAAFFKNVSMLSFWRNAPIFQVAQYAFWQVKASHSQAENHHLLRKTATNMEVESL